MPSVTSVASRETDVTIALTASALSLGLSLLNRSPIMALTVALTHPGQSWTAPFAVFSVVSFVMSFGVGMGPIPWLLPAELFPTQLRASAIATTTVVNWLANYVVGQLFLPLASWLGPLSFLPFAAVLAAGLLASNSRVARRAAAAGAGEAATG